MKSRLQNLLNDLVNLHPKYIDLSLERVEELLNKLGNPHLKLPKTIHIAGTNGKGSVQSYIRNILIGNNYSCDAYISPHLTRFNERIILNNKEVSTKQLYKTLLYVKRINNNNPITFFEITTAAAFLLFSKTKSDFLILETGLGGRLDATNIIPKKLCSIITPISYDHEEYLGKTLKKITWEKLGITKGSSFILIGKQKNEIKGYIENKLSNFKHKYFYGKNFRIKKMNKGKFEFKFFKEKYLIDQPGLNGYHQVENSSIALAFSKIIDNSNIKIDFNKINRIIKETSWPGRLEIINYKNKKVILDGSHNVDGAKKLKDFLIEKNFNPVVIFGMLNNKNIYTFLKIIKTRINKLIAVKIPYEKNAFKTIEILSYCDSLSINHEKTSSLNRGIKYIEQSEERLFLITGSLYLVGSIRKKLL